MPTDKKVKVKGKFPTTRKGALSVDENPLLTDVFKGSVNPTQDLKIRANRDRYQQANFYGGLPNQNLYDLKKDGERFDRFFDYSKRRGAKLRQDDPEYMMRFNQDVNKPFRVPLEFTIPDEINRKSVGAPQVQPETQILRSGGQIGNGYLPEYGFGSWIKDNADGLLGAAGSIASSIPIIGSIAGPVLGGIGSLLGQSKKNKADQAVLDEQTALQAEEQAINDRNIRKSNIVDDKQINYGATFEDGGALGQGFTGQAQITDYSSGNTHQEGVGGIPVDARGNPSATSKSSAVALTEKGEVTWNGYVFSDKLKPE